MDADSFWDAGAGLGGPPGLPLVPAPSYGQPTASQRSQRSLPGPAGRRAAAGAQPAASGVSVGGGGASASGLSLGARPWQDPDFESSQWRQAVEEGGVPFNEDREPFRSNTVRAAAALQHNGVLDRLLAVVASVKRCHSGEAFVRLKDPTGTIGGTLTRSVLENEADIRQGAVLRLRRVTVLRTPPPRRINHLCINLDAVVQVIPPPADGPHAGAAAAVQMPPRQAFPALPAPPTAAAGSARAASWSPQQPLVQQQQEQPPLRRQEQPPFQLPHSPAQPFQQHQQQSPPQQHQQHQQQAAASDLAALGRTGPLAPAASRPGMPPPPRRPVPGPAPSSSFAWPSLAPQQPQQQQQAQRQQQAPQQRQQQQSQQQRQASSFAWPSLQLGGAAQRPAPAQQPMAPQQPAPSASVNFSMPAISDLASPWQRTACQDDASSAPPAQAAVQAAATQPASGGAGGAGWLQGLLAEAEYPFGSIGGSQASQQPLGGLPGRPPLAERRQPQPQAQVSPPGQVAKRARQQHSPPQPLLAAGGTGMVFGGVDDLDLDDE